MTLAEILPLLITLSIFLLVFTLGLQADFRDATFLLRRPSLLLRSILSMNVIMVVFAVIVAALFDLDRSVEIALLAIAVSPVPPILPRKQEKFGGRESYAVGLLVAAVLVSIVLIPVSIDLIGRFFHEDAHMSPGKIVPIVMITALLPLLAGILVRRFAPGLAKMITRPLSLAATLLLIAAVLPVLFSLSGAIWHLVGNGVLVVLILFTLTGLGVGHLLGGPDPDDRTVLALATSARHPGLALAIGTANFPEMKVELMAVIVCHLLVGAIVSIPYGIWRKRTHAATVVSVKP